MKPKMVSMDEKYVSYESVSAEEFENFDKNLTKMSQISSQLQTIERKATFRSRILGYAIANVILAELATIGVGTFSILSWDIMEPVSYLMMLGNFTLGFGWYVMFLTKPEF